MMYSNPTDCPYYLITRASLSATAALKREFAASGIAQVKPAYLGALMCLWMGEGMDETLGKLGSEDGMKLTELGRCAGLEPSTMTGLIDRMERDGLVYRADDPHDRRAQKVHLTPKGIAVRDPVFQAVDNMLRDAFAGIEAGDMDMAKKVLQRILINTNKGNL